MPAFASGLPLVLYVDDHSLRPVLAAGVPRSVRLVPLRLEETATAGLVAAAIPDLALPARRNPAKDTLPFMTMTNAKTELVAWAVRDGLATTPEVGCIDGGIAKVFADPATCFARIRGADVSGLTNVLAPGVRQPGPLAIEEALDDVRWAFCGGLFVLAARRADEVFRRALAKLGEVLALGRCTWEVNVWALLAAEDPTLFHWYRGNFNDELSELPRID